ncbi:MAG: hypothetical protein AAF362_19440 [Pseudomonadota bacterium]
MSFFGDFGRVTRRGFERMVVARQAEAQRYVNNVLLTMDDETLARAGYSREKLLQKERAINPF